MKKILQAKEKVLRKVATEVPLADIKTAKIKKTVRTKPNGMECIFPITIFLIIRKNKTNRN